MSLAGIGLAKATFEPVSRQAGGRSRNPEDVGGHHDCKLSVLVTSLDPLSLPLNLVGNTCGTSQPVSVTFRAAILPRLELRLLRYLHDSPVEPLRPHNSGTEPRHSRARQCVQRLLLQGDQLTSWSRRGVATAVQHDF